MVPARIASGSGGPAARNRASAFGEALGGVFINREHKTRREWLMTGIGIAVICAGLYLIYLSGNR